MAPNHCRRKLFLAALAAVFCLSSTVQAQPPEGQDKPGGAQGTPLFDPDRPPGTVEEVFVTHANEDVFEVFPRLPGANAVPLRKVTQPASNVATTTRSIAVDLIHNEVLIGNDGVSSIVAYSRTANGNATPLRTLAGPRTQLGSPCAIALNTVHDEIVVVDGKFDSVVVFARTAA